MPTVDSQAGKQSVASQMLATKPLDVIMEEAKDTGESSLRRALGPINLITLGIGAIIGAGIFVLTGQAAATSAGPAIVVSFILSGIICAFAGLCYAEFASLIPIAGSAYTYGYATLGEIFAWIIGWDLILEYAFGAATVASGWSGYVVSLLDDLGLHIGPRWIATPGTEMVFYKGHWAAIGSLQQALATAGVDPATLPHGVGVFNAVAFIGIAISTFILVVGIRESANFNSAIVILKVAIVSGVHRGGGRFRSSPSFAGSGQLASVHSAEHGKIRRLRPLGRGPGRRRDFFRLHRIRCRFHSRAGSQESAEGYAHRDYRFVGNLHRSLHIGVRPVDGGGSLYGPECRRSRGHRYRRYRRALGQLASEGRCRRRSRKRYAGDVAWSVPRFLLHVARRASAEMGGSDSFALQDAVDLFDCSRHLRCGLRFVYSHRRSRRTREYRDAAGVRDRMRGCLDSPQKTPRSSAAIQDAAGSLSPDSRHSHVHRCHAEPAGKNLVASAHLAGHWTVDLCVLWANPQQSPPGIPEQDSMT